MLASMFIENTRLLILSVLLMSGLAAGIALSQQPTTSKSEAGLSPDERQIHQAVMAFVEHYKHHDADKLAALFAQDARMEFRDGTEVRGRDALKQSFVDAFQENPKAAISVVLDSIRLLTPDVAVEEGSTNRFPDGETLASQDRYTVLHVKKNGRWLMQSVRITEEKSLSPFAELQPLEWLIGEWIDEGTDENVEVNFQWADNKSFLIEEFKVVRDNEVVLKGTQRIGWDPQKKEIRSWIFDDAGGFSEAVWTQTGDDWVCKAKGVTPDGESASTTRTLTRADNERVIWRSTDRLAAGDRLPDLTVTMVRKPPKPQEH